MCEWARTVGVYLMRMLEFVGPSTRYSDIGTAEYAEFLEELASRLTQYCAPPTPATLNRHLAAVRQVHNYARDLWEMELPPVRWKRLSRIEPRERVAYLTQDEARALLEHLPEHIVRMVAFSVATGCRLGELEALKWEHIRDDQLYLPTSKGGQPREVPLGDAALMVLTHIAAAESSDYVFDITNRRKHWEAAREAAGLEHIRWHDLLHTAATWLAQEGAGLHVIQKVLGHSKIETTMRYARSIQRGRESVAGNLGYP